MSVFRDSDTFRRVFERVVDACIAAGLVGGEGFAVDASLIVADANRQRSIPGSEWKKPSGPGTASRAVRSSSSLRRPPLDEWRQESNSSKPTDQV